ncbi:corticosteroid-binding globulin-like [Suncus etruscus]|uniref:corticosteroid-binding globulin-like n=1 Tax=Suncus etruscus TaxID=109475 RepID=UPI00210FE865|nr:corticosteroid-binding globulin-like [Suncus etruscus]
MLLTLCTFLLGLTLSHPQTIPDDNIMTSKSPYRNLAPNNADFAFDLFKHLVSLNPNKDVLISPISISMTLAMLSLGAKSQTRIRMLKGLGFDLSEISEVEIHQNFEHLYLFFTRLNNSLEMIMGSTLFYDQSLNLMELFSEEAKQYYGLEHLAVDFQSWEKTKGQINMHIKDKTQGEISDLFLELPNQTTLILINYIFFTGTWEQAFDPANTMEKDFYVDAETVVKVPMMFQSSIIKHFNDTELGCMVVQLDYVGNCAVFLILPDTGKMNTVIQALSRDTIHRWSTSMSSRQLDLYMPKLSLSGTYDLMDIMKAMNITDVKINQMELPNIFIRAKRFYSKVTISSFLYALLLQILTDSDRLPH